MALDRKYGRVTTERGTIGKDEPVVVFRAQDFLLPKVLAYYTLFCLGAGARRDHIDEILTARDAVVHWQWANTGHVKMPDPIQLTEPSDG